MKSIIGYTPTGGSNNFSIDLNKPYKGPAETNVDLWLSYSRRQVWRNVDWRIQLNVRNVGQKDSLIPITVQPDGTPRRLPHRPGPSWTIANTFQF